MWRRLNIISNQTIAFDIMTDETIETGLAQQHSTFMLKQQEIKSIVLDMTGRILDQGTAQTNQLIELGSGYSAGLYIVRQ